MNDIKEETFAPWDPDSTFSRLVRCIMAWRQSLPALYELNSDTIYAQQSQNGVTQLLMLHVWYDQCMADLYRTALPGFPESMSDTLPESWARESRQACVAHANGIAASLRTVHTHAGPDFVCLDSGLPFVVSESMRIRVTDAFMAPLEAQPRILANMTDDFTLMMDMVDRMKPYFRQAVWLVRNRLKSTADVSTKRCVSCFADMALCFARVQRSHLSSECQVLTGRSSSRQW